MTNWVSLLAVLWPLICSVESGGDPSAYNPAEQAAGIAQIRPILVKDLNRIHGRKVWTLEDRWDPEASRQMFEEYLTYYGRWYQRRYKRAPTMEVLARLWNGGPGNWDTTAAERYWKKVKTRYAYCTVIRRMRECLSSPSDLYRQTHTWVNGILLSALLSTIAFMGMLGRLSWNKRR